MSLPPTFLDELRNRLSLTQVVGRKVVWDNRKSNPGKGDMWAPCPFHQEKSASFHVDDRKGFYYCFGCHAKGDAVTFVKETENVGFMEAVEILAREAGMPMPARDPRAAEKADRRASLSEVMEQVVQFYRLQLKTAAAASARDYLARRGLTPEACERWDIGFAPDARQALIGALAAKGIAQDQMVATGMVAKADDGSFYDRFRGRITFPIRDGRGRAISLGGRAMDPNARAKYLNGPETDLFDKGRNLFNLGPAREMAGKGKPLVVAEGYMDVIALAEAGFAAVAPLGTAVTEDQIRLMWRVADEPVIALDGDKAGIRAAERVIDLALPLLESGKGLRFAILPEGMDPDDLIRKRGAEAMAGILAGAEPMVRLLWQRETTGKVFDSPERKAALDKTLRSAIARIQDPSIRAHYGEEVKQLRWELFRTGRKPAARTGRFAAKDVQAPVIAKSSQLASGSLGEDELREAVILAVIVANPPMRDRFEHEIEAMDCRGEGHALIRDALLALHISDLPQVGGSGTEGRKGDAPETDGLGSGGPGTGAPDSGVPETDGPETDRPGKDGLRSAVAARIGAEALERLMSQRHVSVCPAVVRPGDGDLAQQTLTEEFAKLRARRGHAQALEEAMHDIEGLPQEWLTRRLQEAAAGIDTTRPRETEDAREVHVAPNGLAVDKEERHALDRLMDTIRYNRGRD